MQTINMIHVFGAFLLPLVALATPYEHTAPRFAFDYDDTAWEMTKAPAPVAREAEVDKKMAEKTLVTVQRRQADAKYHARFSVVLDEAKRFEKAGVPLVETYRDHAVEFLKGQRFAIQSVKEIKLPGAPSPAFEILGNQRDFGLTFRQIVFLDGSQAVLLTGATRTDKYDEQSKDIEKILTSFKWGKK